MHELKGLDIKASVYKALKAIQQHVVAMIYGYVILLLLSVSVYADPSQIPLSLTTAGKPNLLVILDTSNSMDEDATGVAVGSNCPTSKSEIARKVIKNMINSYTGDINMGLMTYQQSPKISTAYINDGQYDVSYNSINYPAQTDPLTIYPRYSPTKSYRIPNPMSLGEFIYYNYRSPVYLDNNYGFNFCYSPTADAETLLYSSNGFNNNENSTGKWPIYRCYNKKTGSSDTLPIWADSVSESAQGYSSFIRTLFNNQPSDSDNAAGIVDFGKQETWSPIGSAYYADGTSYFNVGTGFGYLQTPIAPLTPAQGTTISTLLACNVPNYNLDHSLNSTLVPASCTQNAPCTNVGIKNAGNTPIQGTLQTASNYFAGTLNDAAQGYSASTYPLPNSCGHNFVILVTDGLPDTYIDNGTIKTDSTKAQSGAVAAAEALLATDVKTYVVGFGSEVQAGSLDKIAVAGGTGASYSASNYPTLQNALDSILQNILSNTSNSAASVAANSTQLNTGTLLYQAKYDAKDWSGQLLAYKLDTNTGAIIKPAKWEASSLLPKNARHIYTYNPSSGGIPVLWGNLTATQQTYLNTLSGTNDSKGSDRVAWLSGDQSQEQAHGGIFRNRTNLLGDIVNSSPVYVGSQNYGYGSLLGTEGSSYNTFINSSAYINRTAMLYVGANDGMLHGFDASSNSTGGQEIFAYIPNALYPKLSQLTSPTYGHQFYVDGLSGVGDYYDPSTTPPWHTLLAGVTGAGGKAVFALDVTDPSNFSASKVLWEFSTVVQPVTPACNAWGPNINYDVNDLGYTLGQPLVFRLQDGHWVVLVANGYNSTNGHAVLFVLDAKSGCVIQKIDTSAADTSGLATPNGLSAPIAIDTNNPIDLSADTVYAGDLHGNFWKFDWSVSDGRFLTPVAPFFVACTTAGSCASANRQPITAAPIIGAVGTDQNNQGWMVYFGTGKYFESGDNIVGVNPQVQSFYGLWDIGTAITDRNQLQAQTITYQGLGTLAGTSTTTTDVITVVSQNSVCYASTSVGCTVASPLNRGWVFDLNYPTTQGERVVSAPLVRRGLVVFESLIPSANQCTAGGTSNLFELGAFNGGQTVMAAFDINDDGKVDNQDKVLINGVAQFVSGINLGIGIINTPTIIAGSTVDYKYFSGSTGEMATVTDAGGSQAKRSWRQLK